MNKINNLIQKYYTIHKIIGGLLLFVSVGVVYGASIPNTFSSGQSISSVKMIENFNSLGEYLSMVPQIVYIENIPYQEMSLDQAAQVDDLLCPPTIFCSSFQSLIGATTQDFMMNNDAYIFVSISGNYNCDGCADVFSYPFMHIILELSTNGGEFVEVVESQQPQAIYVPNSGVDFIRRYKLDLQSSNYTIRFRHRFAVNQTSSAALTRMKITSGLMRVEKLQKP